MMEAVRTPETSVNICLATRQYIPEDSKRHVLDYFTVKSSRHKKTSTKNSLYAHAHYFAMSDELLVAIL
jgi:hypothetical protein